MDRKRCGEPPLRVLSNRVVAGGGFLVSVSIYFLLMAGDGLHTGINSDDVGNLNVYAFQPWSEIVKENILYFSPAYRPAGALFYRPLFSMFRFAPLPYRAVCFFLLIVNLWLGCFAIRKFTGSMEIAAIATLIAAFHPAFRDLYASSGTIYDILCYTCYFGAWLYYLRTRGTGPTRRVSQFASVVILYIAALNAKEMAVTFPALLVLTELAYADSRNLRSLLPGCLLAITAGIATAPYIWGKLSPSSLFHNLSTYQYEIGLIPFLRNCGEYLDALLYRDGVVRSHWFGAMQVAILFGAMLGVALALRSKQLLFCWSMILVSFLPIAFIPPRAAYAFYFPFAFWSLYIAVLVVTLRDRLVATPIAGGRVLLRQIALVTIVFLLLIRAHRIERQRMSAATELGWPLIASIVTALDRGHPAVPGGSTVLAVNDPYPKGQFGLVLLLRLYFRDGRLEVDHADKDDCRYASSIVFCGGSIRMVQHSEPCQAVRCGTVVAVPVK
jgi:hypothetical protein